jgi:hypothetical protein
MARREVLVEAAEEATLVDGGVPAESPPVDVIQLDLAGGAAHAAVLERPRAAAVVPLPHGAPDRGGDVSAAVRRRWRWRRCGSLVLRWRRTRLRPDAAPLRVPLEDEVEADLEDLFR